MNKYRVMLVDVEEDVIQVIIRKMNWEKLGFTVQGYAHNGLEALEMAEEEQPDVVMTDIKMPFMDGLELSRRLKEQYPTIKIIIFSGFDTDLLKMFSAVVVAVFLGAPHVKAQLKAHSRSKKGDSGHAENE